MFAYQKFSILNKEHFIASEFPKLEASLQQVAEQLASEPASKIEMLVSFVKDHCINSVQVREYPALATAISNGSMPLQPMEALFEESRNYPVFRKELEAHIRKYLSGNEAGQGFVH